MGRDSPPSTTTRRRNCHRTNIRRHRSLQSKTGPLRHQGETRTVSSRHDSRRKVSLVVQFSVVLETKRQTEKTIEQDHEVECPRRSGCTVRHGQRPAGRSEGQGSDIATGCRHRHRHAHQERRPEGSEGPARQRPDLPRTRWHEWPSES